MDMHPAYADGRPATAARAPSVLVNPARGPRRNFPLCGVIACVSLRPASRVRGGATFFVRSETHEAAFVDSVRRRTADAVRRLGRPGDRQSDCPELQLERD